MSRTLTVGMSDDEEVKLMQRALNEKLKINLVADGSFGKLTQDALCNYQSSIGVSESGCYDEATREQLDPYIKQRFVGDEDIISIANQINVSPAILFAFKEIEGAGAGFFNDGRAVLLFERHCFYRDLVKNKGQALADSTFAMYPDICNPKRGGYIGGKAEYTRMAKAATIDNEAALRSASHGMFQIMGFNHKACGYNNVVSMVSDFNTSEDLQLLAMAKFIKNNARLYAAIQSLDFYTAAELYNGSAQDEGPGLSYDARLKNAYLKYIAKG